VYTYPGSSPPNLENHREEMSSQILSHVVYSVQCTLTQVVLLQVYLPQFQHRLFH
jgi:hypothetical protein